MRTAKTLYTQRRRSCLGVSKGQRTTMKKIVTYVLIFVAALVGLVGCGSTDGGPKPSKAACTAAVKAALDKGTDTDTEPKACHGLSDKTVTTIIKQQMSASLGDQGWDVTFN